jgi:pilus assembly protein CpaB
VSLRKFMLLLGVVFIGAGLWLAFIWVNNRQAGPVETSQPKPVRPAALVAISHIPSGTLLREGDFGWKELSPGEVRPEYLMRGTVSEAEILGAITRRDFARGEPLDNVALVKPNDRNFLAAVLRPGHRAVSITVDKPQTAYGLVIPGDFVDVILVQNFGDNVASASQRSSGETILQNLRVVALARMLKGKSQAVGEPLFTTDPDNSPPETITLEVDARQAEKLYVAMQLGTLQLAVRPLEGSGADIARDPSRTGPVWASEVSQAIRQMSLAQLRTEPEAAPAKTVRPFSTGSSLERLIRRPPPASAE